MILCIKTYIIAYVKTQKIRFIIHYVKSTAQLLFKIRFPRDLTVHTIMAYISLYMGNIPFVLDDNPHVCVDADFWIANCIDI